MIDRKSANYVSAAVFAIVLLVGAVVIGGHTKVEHPKTTTTVSKKAVTANDGTSQRTEEVITGARGRTKTKTVTTVTPSAPASTTTTTVDEDRSFFERMLGDTGVIFLQIGVILLAAFIAGGVAQRVLVGQYGGVKFGSLEISDLAGASTESIEELKTSLTVLQQNADAQQKAREALQGDLKKVRGTVKKLVRDSNREDAELNRYLSVMASRLATVEQQLEDDDG